MGLLDKGINPVKGYISFQDLLLHISGLNNHSVWEVIQYLLYHEVYNIKTYFIDLDSRNVHSSSRNALAQKFLNTLEINLCFTNTDWVYSNYESIEKLPDKTRQNLLLTFLEYKRFSFKIADLMRFEPLKDLLHFDVSYYDQIEHKQTKLSENQKRLITFAVLTPHQIACLLTDSNPDGRHNHDNDEYNIYREMVYAALKNSELISINNIRQIKVEQVKIWLAKLDFIFKGFNDDLKNNYYSIDGLLLDYQRRIAELEQEVTNAKATGNFSMGTLMVEHGEPKTNEQLINELAAANDQIANLESQLEQSTTDKRSYTTLAMNIMDKVITKFWLDYDPSQPAPKQEFIVRWITGNFDGVSKALALNIDKVCRHSEARSGGKYKR